MLAVEVSEEVAGAALPGHVGIGAIGHQVALPSQLLVPATVASPPLERAPRVGDAECAKDTVSSDVSRAPPRFPAQCSTRYARGFRRSRPERRARAPPRAPRSLAAS